MKKQELIERLKDLKAPFGDESEYVKIDTVIKLASELDERQKVTVPQFVADWIEECKNDDFHLFGAMEGISSNKKKLDYWFREDDNMELFARAWLDGYTVEEEKRFLVKVKNIGDGWEYLKWNSVQQYWYFGNKKRLDDVRLYHTLENLQKGGFGNVFVNPLFTIEEVE